MTKPLLICLSVIMLSACSLDPESNQRLFSENRPAFADQIADENGVPAWLISCVNPFQHCIDKAKEVCPTGFVGERVGSAQAQTVAPYMRYLKQRYKKMPYNQAVGYCSDVFAATYGQQQ